MEGDRRREADRQRGAVPDRQRVPGGRPPLSRTGRGAGPADIEAELRSGPASAAPSLLYDASRLCTRALNPTPNGIDRLDGLLARGLLGGGDGASAVVFGFGGPRLVRPSTALAALDRAERAWRERQRPGRDAEAVAALAAGLAAPPSGGRGPPPGGRRAPPSLRGFRGALATLASLGVAGGPAPEKEAAPGAVYLNASHFPLDWPSHVAWLRRRPDVRLAMLVHDLLPVDHPEWFWRGEGERHRARLAVLAERGAGAIVTSEGVEDRLRAEMARAGRRTLPILRAVPPVAAAFRVPRASDPALGAARYFVICGTVEPRKNHALLIRLWRRLAAERGSAAPKLVVVGKRGWLCGAAMEALDGLSRSGHVVLAHGLPSGAYRTLLDHSLGLLAPSFAEGYGLPVAEARARGVPVLASDIPPFREQGADRLLDPHDDRAWHDAVEVLAAAGPAARRAVRTDGAAAEHDYLAAVRGFLATLP